MVLYSLIPRRGLVSDLGVLFLYFCTFLIEKGIQAGDRRYLGAFFRIFLIKMYLRDRQYLSLKCAFLSNVPSEAFQIGNETWFSQREVSERSMIMLTGTKTRAMCNFF